MNKILGLLFVLMVAFNSSFAGLHLAKDSLGIDKKDGVTFILHKVDAKETFYSISKRYNVSIDEIVKNNPETKDGLKLEQVIRIPYLSNTPSQTNVAQNNTQPSRSSEKGTIVHTVKPSETMFSISRQYNVKIEDIKSWNNINGTELNIGQELVIRSNSSDKNNVEQNQNSNTSHTSSNTSQQISSNTVASSGNSIKDVSLETNDAKVVHTVEPTQTLFSISRMYNVTVDDLKKWNELQQSELSVGQKLIVKRKSEQEIRAEVVPEKKNDITAHDKTEIKEQFESYDESAQRTSKAEVEKAEKAKAPQTQILNSSGGSKIVELGFAEVIEGTDDTKKFRALHKTAPVGTIIQVKNEMNNLSVFVRVLGTLPNTGTNDKTLIKITKAAYERLGAIDPRFPVEISYVP